jgi:hypothetical protein
VNKSKPEFSDVAIRLDPSLLLFNVQLKSKKDDSNTRFEDTLSCCLCIFLLLILMFSALSQHRPSVIDLLSVICFESVNDLLLVIMCCHTLLSSMSLGFKEIDGLIRFLGEVRNAPERVEKLEDLLDEL